VRGILVTEGVRGEGGVLRNNQNRRFMLDDIPENYRSSTADNEEEGWRYVIGDKSARRPPELLTRDHVARCIVREVKAGRGSPHGGVFLDIAWIKEKLGREAGDHIKKKLPSMYHQFMQLAGVDITKEAMEVGPTVHYVMGGVKVDGETQMSTVAGLFAAGEVAAGLHGANRLGGNSLSDLLVFGKLAGEHAAKYAKQNGAGKLDETQINQIAAWALAPFGRSHAAGAKGGGANGVAEGPYQIQHELQEMMQANVGIVRTQNEMERAVEALQLLKQRAQRAGAHGNREYNPGWHTALDLHNLMVISEAIAMSALDRRESRGAHFRDDYPAKDEANFGKHNTIIRRDSNGGMLLLRQPLTAMRDDLKKIIEENK
jgi:succinate dehydrogenase / fumarate reductase flavoprotein subunit